MSNAHHPKAAPAPFDALAAQYDVTEANNPILQWMRQRVQRAARATFAPQSRLLEIGCGTGTDALFFAQHGYEIVATDPSAEMLTIAQEKVARAGLATRTTFAQVGFEQMPLLIERYGRATFDGIYSNFGALNCTREVLGFAKSCLQLLRPGGKLMLCFMPPVCPWEMLYYFLRFEPREALRRVDGQPEYGGLAVKVGERWVRTYYHSVGRLKFILEERFELLSQFALGVIAPPPYLARYGWLFKSLRRLDEKMSGWPLLRNAGDHVVMILRRR